MTGLDGIQKPLVGRGCGEADLDLGEGLLDRDDLGEPLARDQGSSMVNTAIPAAGKWMVS